MNCCNHDCQQGDACPNRIKPDRTDKVLTLMNWALAIVCILSLALAVLYGIAATGGFTRIEEIKAVEADKLEAIRAAQLRQKFERAASAMCGENASWTEVEPGTVQCLTKHARKTGGKVAL